MKSNTLMLWTALLALHVAAAVSPADSLEVDNGFTAGKLFSLPLAERGGKVIDQAVLDSAYGGTAAGMPDLFVLCRGDDQQSAVIHVYKTDPKAIDFGLLARSPPIALPGQPVSIATAPAPGFARLKNLADGYPPIWIACQGQDQGSVVVLDSRTFGEIDRYSVGPGTIRDLLALDTPLNGTATPASDPSLPDLLLAVEGSASNDIHVLSSRDGTLLHKFAAPAGRISAMAAAPLPDKSAAVQVDDGYPWLLLATQGESGSALTLLNLQTGAQNGGPLAAPPGVVTGISIADTPVGGADPKRPDLFVSYASAQGDNLIAVYHSFSNVLLVTYPARSPKGQLKGLHVQATDLDLGTGGDGHPAIFFAIALPLAGLLACCIGVESRPCRL